MSCPAEVALQELPHLPAPLSDHDNWSCGVSYRASGMAAAGPRLQFRMARSDRDTEGAEEYKHLWGDAVYSAVDDADDGDREATRNIRHGTLPSFGVE